MGNVAATDDVFSQFNSEADILVLWEAWKAGDTLRCRADGAPIALSVDATVSTYRFVCTHCGNASPWFQVLPTGLRLRLSTTDSGSRPSARNQ